MFNCKTIREAVTLYGDWWGNHIGDVILRNSMTRNELTSKHGNELRDSYRMEMCTKYGRHWQDYTKVVDL